MYDGMTIVRDNAYVKNHTCPFHSKEVKWGIMMPIIFTFLSYGLQSRDVLAYWSIGGLYSVLL